MKNIGLMDSIKKLCLRSLVLMAVLFAANANAEVVKMLLMGDTQKIVNEDPNNFLSTMDKVLTNSVTKNASFIMQMGDLTENSYSANWDTAQTGWRKLEGKMPFVLNIGNNDTDGESNPGAKFIEHFPLSRYNASSSITLFKNAFVSNYNDNRNFAYKYSAGGVDWLIISLWRFPGSSETNWAGNLINANSSKKVIIVNHTQGLGDTNIVWNMVKTKPNVVFMFCGHNLMMHETLTANDGHKIGRVQTCWHNKNNDHYLGVVLADTAAGTVNVSYYSPLNQNYKDLNNSTYNWSWSGFDFGGSTASCHIDVPTGSVTKNVGDTLLVKVSASDPDGVERVKLYLNGVEGPSDSSSPYDINLPLPSAGTFTLTAKVKDVNGNYTASDNSRTITVTSGTTTTTVPWVTNLTLSAATTSITGAGLVVGNVSSNYSSTVAAGKIFSQTPGGGTTVNRGTSVALAVSLGPQTSTTTSFTSVAAHDGYVDESSETSNVGGSMSATLTSGTALRVGDTGARKQRKTFVSFNTASLPDTAVVTKAVLKLKRGGIVGTPTSLGAITVDIKNTSVGFGTTEALETGDFQAAASKSNVGTLSYPTANDTWATATLNADGISRINKTDHTQFRVRFVTDDDNDSADDYLGFYSGDNATAANRPVLEITYY